MDVSVTAALSWKKLWYGPAGLSPIWPALRVLRHR